MIAKLADSKYDGRRSTSWLKFKCVRDQEFVVGGYTSPKGSRVELGALLLGYYAGHDLVYAGKVGTGFDEATLHRLHERLSAITRDTPAFTRGLVREAGAHWVRPEMVVQIGFTEWTRDGNSPPALPRHAHRQSTRRRRTGDTLMPRIDVEVTHPDRVLFPADGITKRDLVAYYGEVADTMLPHLRGRALNVQRFPRGIGERGFIQQDFADSLPDWMGRVEVAKEGGTVVHPVAERREALQWLANQNGITLHAWQSRQSHLDNPDRLVFDLDPSDSDFAVLRATAHAIAGVLRDLGLARYVQTTGSRGLHVVVPLRADTDFDTARQFARDVAEVVVADDAAHRTVEVRKEKRGARVYLDIMRNAYAQTAVAPYSVRAPMVPRWPPHWSGMNWTLAGCGRTDSQSAIFPNGWPANAIRGRTCPGTPAH